MRSIAQWRAFVLALGLAGAAATLQAADGSLRITPTVSNDRLLVSMVDPEEGTPYLVETLVAAGAKILQKS